MASHLRRVYLHSQEKIKLQYLSKQDYICFTQDAWTAPNVTAFMAVTAHFVNEKFQLIDLTLAIPNVQGLYSLFPQPLFQLKGLFFLSAPLGKHTGKNFADLFYGVLSDYKLLDKLHTITADNASTNGRMARELQILLPSFNASTNLLGCVAHVINLGAKAGMAVLGGIEDDGEEEEISMVDDDSDEPHPSRSVMRISNLTSTPDGVAVNLRTILKRIHSMCTYVRLTPQRRERFCEVVGFAQPDLRDSGTRLTTLKIDVSTGGTRLLRCLNGLSNFAGHAIIIVRRILRLGLTFYLHPNGIKQQTS
ncbi:hypothetical protein PSHT_02905 [Puccinia striiformis]|uniref:DUF659 domain-containing protein n=1 Tax=Puccinia striiformis TaxID=27350 RepID=A0A2S4WGV0_9BASI|nr:hypothetical protein PSHT_02905 [Puccinia striiformis]